MDADLSPLTRLVLEGQALGVFDDELGRALHECWSSGAADPWVQGQIESRVHDARVARAFRPTPFDEARLENGEITLGHDPHTQAPLRVVLCWLLAHSLTVANSGAGKTTRARFLALQVARLVRGLWLMDLRKREYRVLAPLMARMGVDLFVVLGRLLRINPLQAPRGVAPLAWCASVSDLLTRVLQLPPRATKLVASTVHRLYRTFGVLDGGDQYPTLFDLYLAIRDDRTANAQARLAVCDALEPVLLSLGPDVLAWRRGWETSDLASLALVFEFADLTDVDRDLLVNTLVISEFTARLARGVSNSQMDLWVSVDEAQRLCSHSAANPSGGALDGLIQVARGTGIGLDLGVQSVAGLSSQVVSNTSLKLLGRCGSMTDYSAIGGAMGLSGEQVRWAQQHLVPGLFVAMAGEGAWRRPWLVRIPPMEMGCVRMPDVLPAPAFDESKTIRASEFDRWPDSPPSVRDAEAPSDPVFKSPFLSEQEVRLCMAVRDHPLQPLSAYPKLAAMSPTSAIKARTALIDRGFIRQRLLESGGPGRPAKCLEILAAGEAALESHERKV